MAKFKIKDGVAIISKNVKKIGEKAFMNSSELTSVIIPEGVTIVGRYPFFTGCNKLKAIYVPAQKAAYYQKRLSKYLHSLIVEQETSYT